MAFYKRNYRRCLLRVAIEPLLLFALCFVLSGEARAGSQEAVWPEASGETVLMDGNLLMDCSHSSKGYVMVCIMSPTGNHMKLRTVFNGMQLLYDLDDTGAYVVIPLQFGSGYYSFSLYENVGGTKYAGAGNIDLSVSLEDENAAFLVTNQYVSYTKESPSVTKSDELTDGKSKSDTFQEICNFIAAEFSYDYVRAVTISPGELPEVDSCFEARAGICQDLSAVMISMLRVQGIPSKLIIGFADGYYHAWTVSIVDGQEIFFDPTHAVNAMDASSYTAERFY